MPKATDKKKKIEEIEVSEDTQRIYEVGYHIVPSVPEEGVGEEVTKIKTLIEDNTGVVIAEEFPQIRPLAYTIYRNVAGRNEGFENAYFGWMKFEASSKAIEKISEGLEGNDKIVRFLSIKTVRENTMAAPKIIAVKKDGQKKDDETKPAEKDKEPITEKDEVEIDKSIEELVIE